LSDLVNGGRSSDAIRKGVLETKGLDTCSSE
jgi:hypothetical protein